jgi:2-polyprenyl-3-methyl-5-hydroxy-6-metoxy-1,4-benzoquinol methylase
MDLEGWDNFWKNQRHSFNDVMKIGTTFFAVQLTKSFDLKSGDEILDYGCGPCFLADHLAPKQVVMTCADINTLFIEQGKKNHPAFTFITITSDTGVNRKIFEEQLKGKKFDFIILLSIAQYLKNVTILDEVVKMLFPFVKERGKIVIADVIDKSSSAMNDALSLFVHCVKKGKIIAFFRFILYLLFSDYRKLSGGIELLKITEESMREIANNNSLNYKKVQGLTIHSSRTTYLLEKRLPKS